MKKIVVFILVIIFSTTTVQACDICGCGNNGNYIGILPEFQKYIIGVRYRHNVLRSHLGANGQTTYLTNHEKYSSYELWGSIKLSKKMNLLFTVPYNYNQQVGETVNQRIQGIGDINLINYYTVFQSNQLTKQNKVFLQSLRAAMGVKLPTGKFDMVVSNVSSQLFTNGTGTLDFMLGAVYEARLQNTGINFSSNYKLNTENSTGYQYGNKFQSSAQLYQKFFVGMDFSIAPNLGIQIEQNNKDQNLGNEVGVSGGDLTTINYGAELKFKKVLIGGNLQTPIAQNIANHQIEANQRWMLHFSFAF
jgi:hypothetical protein